MDRKYEQLLETVTAMGSPNVLVVGDYMLDIYTHGDAVRISPEAPVAVLKVKDRIYQCGGAGSIVANLSQLGASVSCLGIVGDDTESKTLKKLLKEHKANTTDILTIKGRPTTSKQRLVGLAQHIHKQQLIRIDEECTDEVTAQQQDKLLVNLEKALKHTDILCLQDHNKGLLTPGFCKKAIRAAKKMNKKILIDPYPAADYSKYTGASVITPNRKETSLAVGFEVKTIKDAQKAARELLNKLKLEAVIITLDKDGAFLHTRDKSLHIRTNPKSVYDVTGAGDMVLAVLAITIASGCRLETAVSLANIASGLVVEKFGTATVSKEEIINEIITQNKKETDKLQPTDRLTFLLDYHRRKGDKIVFTNGCFDVIHTGHIKYLQFCKSLGDIVVVGMNSDSSVKKIKGPERPVNNEKDRAFVLAAMEMIDYIVIFTKPDPLDTIKKVRPDILVKGEEWAEKGVVGREFVETHGGEVVLAKMVKGKSSTATIKALKALKK